MCNLSGTAGKWLFAVPSELYRAHFFGCMAKRCFAVQFFQGARCKNAQQNHYLSCVFCRARQTTISPIGRYRRLQLLQVRYFFVTFVVC
jgi:hypothetical protein